jgi:hypothetical protein
MHNLELLLLCFALFNAGVAGIMTNLKSYGIAVAFGVTSIGAFVWSAVLFALLYTAK